MPRIKSFKTASTSSVYFNNDDFYTEQVKLFADVRDLPHTHDFANRDMTRFRFDYVDIRQRKNNCTYIY